MKNQNVAIVGATGVVGQELLKILEERNFPIENLRLLASAKSKGITFFFKGADITVETLTAESFKDIDIALFSAGGSISKEFAPIAVKSGAVVIDNTSHFRMDKDVPLVVPEVNAHAIQNHNGIIANPNCSTAQMVVALNPIHKAAKIKRIVVATYQSVSGSGKEAMAELEKQSRLNLNGSDLTPEHFPHPIAFNVIPQIDVFEENGYTKEEIKMVNETKKILEDDTIAITATAVRVPVFIGHSEAINIQTQKKLTVKEVKALLSNQPGIELMDDPQNNIYPTPKQTSGQDPVFIGRIREDISHPSAIDLWCVSDNLRKGAALNAIQIAESLIANV